MIAVSVCRPALMSLTYSNHALLSILILLRICIECEASKFLSGVVIICILALPGNSSHIFGSKHGFCNSLPLHLIMKPKSVYWSIPPVHVAVPSGWILCRLEDLIDKRRAYARHTAETAWVYLTDIQVSIPIPSYSEFTKYFNLLR